MKVSIFGFEMRFAKGIDVGDFYANLERLEDKEFTVNYRESVLYTDVIEGYICGLILNYRTDKKSLVAKRDKKGDLTITKNTLKKNEHGTEVSVFVINPLTLRGAFYSYAGATSASGFSKLFRKIHNQELSYKKRSYSNELTQFGTKTIDKLTERVAKKYPGEFGFNILTTPSDLKALLNRYSEINSLTVRAVDALSDGGRYTPLEDISKKSSVNVDVEKSWGISDIKNKIMSVFGGEKAEALRIVGLSHTGQELSLVLGENNDNFGKMEYDEFVDLLPTDKWKNYSESAALIKLLQKIKENDVVFGEMDTSVKWKKIGPKDYMDSGLLSEVNVYQDDLFVK